MYIGWIMLSTNAEIHAIPSEYATINTMHVCEKLEELLYTDPHTVNGSMDPYLVFLYLWV